MELLKVEDLSFTYPDNTTAVENISLAVKQGEFVLLCGVSGCGKSTLLRLLKPHLEPRGQLSGKRYFAGVEMEALSDIAAASDIGFVMQSPDGQIVTDKVWHELAFGLESIGLKQDDIRRRVGEMACYFGIESLFDKDTSALSGGQKQLVNLASAAALHPELLILDEPTSRLDPISAQEFVDAVYRLNRDFGITVIMAEHRLEEVLCIADRVLVMEGGRITADCAPKRLYSALCDGHPLLAALPAAARAYRAAGGSDDAPLTVREGRNDSLCREYISSLKPHQSRIISGNEAVSAHGLWVSYGKHLPDTLRSVDISVKAGEIYALLGGNGSGKSTLLKALAGIIKPLGGKVRYGKGARIAYLPQEPYELFTQETVSEELAVVCAEYEEIAQRFKLNGLMDKHPYDLSGGEVQRLAMAKLMLKAPDILLLDEPTKGMDAAFRTEFAEYLTEIAEKGTAVLLVTHDTELAALCAYRCGMLFGGEIVSEDEPERFFADNYFYTPPVCRLARGISDGVLTL